MKQIFALVALVLAVAVLATDAPAASFQPLGLGPGATQSFAWDVSADGSVVVGSHWVPSGFAIPQRAFRWASGVFQDLGSLDPDAPEAQALGVSDDGSRVVGWSRAISGFQRPFLWTPATGMQEIPDIPGSDAVAADISGDGATIVGYFLDVDGYHAFRWNTGVVTDLGFIPGGRDSKAQAVCGLGTAVVGSTLTHELAQRAFRWRFDTGIQDLGGLPGVQTSYAEGCSDDGTVVIGASTDSKGNLLATHWDPTGTGSLGTLGGNSSEAHAVSADGAVIVGGAGLPFVAGISEFSAFRWNSATRKMEQLSRILENLGVTDVQFCHQVPCPAGTWFLQLALGISSDGNVIVGFAQDPNGNLQAYRAVVSTIGGEVGPCPAGSTPLTLTVTTAPGAAAGSVSSGQKSTSGQPLVVSSGQTGSACFQSNTTLVLQAANKALADWSGDPAIACKGGNFGQNRCEFVPGTASQSVTATLK